MSLRCFDKEADENCKRSVFKGYVERLTEPFCHSCGRAFRRGEWARHSYVVDNNKKIVFAFYICEKCDDLLQTFEEQGYDVYKEVCEYGTGIATILEEYWKLTGFDPKFERYI